MAFPHLVILPLIASSTALDVIPKQIGAPAADLVNERLRSPDPAAVARPFGHAMIPLEFDGHGNCECSIPIPSTDRLSLVPIGHNSDDWVFQAMDPDGERDGIGWTRRFGDMQPFIPQETIRLDVENPTPGTWTVAIANATPGTEGYLLIRDHSGVALQMHAGSYASLVEQPKIMRVSLAPVDAMGNPLMDAVHAYSQGLEITRADMSWHGPDGMIIEQPMGRSGPWLEQTFVPVTEGAHECRIQIEGIDSLGHRFIRTGIHHFYVEVPVELIEFDTRAIDSERLAIDLVLAGADTRESLLLSGEAWCLGEGGMQPRSWVGGISPVVDGVATLVLDRRWLTAEGGSGDQLTIRSLRIASPNAARPLLRSGADHSLQLGDIPIPPELDTDDSTLQAMRHGKGDVASLRIRSQPWKSPSRSDRYGGHNLMLSHGYCSDADSWNPSDFSGDVAEYINMFQNFSHDQFAQDFIVFGSQYKSYGIVGHSQGGNAAVHLYTFYWSGLDWADDGRLIQCLGTPFSGTSLAGNLSILGELFGFGCGVNYDLTYDGAAEWLSYIPTSTRENTWTWTSTVEDQWWSYDYCHFLTDLVLWDPDDGVVENAEGDLDGANNMGTTIGWCHIKDMSEPREVDDTNRSSEMDAEAAR